MTDLRDLLEYIHIVSEEIKLQSINYLTNVLKKNHKGQSRVLFVYLLLLNL